MKTVYKMSQNQVCRKTFSKKKNLNVHVDHNVIGVYHEVRNETIINIEERGVALFILHVSQALRRNFEDDFHNNSKEGEGY